MFWLPTAAFFSGDFKIDESLFEDLDDLELENEEEEEEETDWGLSSLLLPIKNY